MSEQDAKTIALASADIRTGPAYLTAIHADHHDLSADEGVHGGGKGAAPSPFGLVLSGLGACTAMTLRMYAERKGWPLSRVHVNLAYRVDGDHRYIDRILTLDGALDDAQRARLADIAERTPVTLAIKGGLPINTSLHAPAG
ncbi:MAG: OsmC family protein [Caulobacteraceae bacterium]|nr:OsmC family protein [Caulobacteraceae bacterium]